MRYRGPVKGVSVVFRRGFECASRTFLAASGGARIGLRPAAGGRLDDRHRNDAGSEPAWERRNADIPAAPRAQIGSRAKLFDVLMDHDGAVMAPEGDLMDHGGATVDRDNDLVDRGGVVMDHDGDLMDQGGILLALDADLMAHDGVEIDRDFDAVRACAAELAAQPIPRGFSR